MEARRRKIKVREVDNGRNPQKTIIKPFGEGAQKHVVSGFRRCFKPLSQKIHSEGNSDKAKQGWARVLVSAVSTYSGLLKDEELELRVIELEEKLKNSILIPKSEGKKK